MKIVIAPNALKGCLTAAEAAEALPGDWSEARTFPRQLGFFAA